MFMTATAASNGTYIEAYYKGKYCISVPDFALHPEHNFITKIRLECTRIGVFGMPASLQQIVTELMALSQGNYKDPKGNLILSIMYSTWKARNNFVHGQSFSQPAAIVIDALCTTNPSLGNWRDNSNHLVPTVWTSPPQGWIKINYDGSVRENSMAGLGCAIRDCQGNLLAATSKRLCSNSVDMTELRSALCGLELANNLFNSRFGVILEGDSTATYYALNRILAGTYSGNFEARIAHLLKDENHVFISLVGRDANGVADYFSKLACENDLSWVRGMPLPQNVLQFLLLDSCARL